MPNGVVSGDFPGRSVLLFRRFLPVIERDREDDLHFSKGVREGYGGVESSGKNCDRFHDEGL